MVSNEQLQISCSHLHTQRFLEKLALPQGGRKKEKKENFVTIS